mgnify:CR=1 FL=1|jgi:DNA primase
MTSEEIKDRYSMIDIAIQYGFQPTRKGYICCPFHSPRERTPSMKLYGNNYHCYGCGEDGTIFDFVMKMDNLTFREAFEQLGGTYKHNFSSLRKTELSTRKRNLKHNDDRLERIKLQLNNRLIGIYRKGTEMYEPFSDEWCYCYNKLMYQLYVSEVRANDHRGVNT